MPIIHEILKAFLGPNEINIARNSYDTPDNKRLEINGEVWTAGGANVSWLDLDENTIPLLALHFILLSIPAIRHMVESRKS